jgi:hypothetical protein
MAQNVESGNATERPWPTYLIPSRDVLFAIGVARANYNQLEAILLVLFMQVTGIQSDIVMVVFARLGNAERLDLMKASLDARRWPSDVDDLIRHFLSGYAACADNRCGTSEAEAHQGAGSGSEEGCSLNAGEAGAARG